MADPKKRMVFGEIKYAWCGEGGLPYASCSCVPDFPVVFASRWILVNCALCAFRPALFASLLLIIYPFHPYTSSVHPQIHIRRNLFYHWCPLQLIDIPIAPESDQPQPPVIGFSDQSVIRHILPIRNWSDLKRFLCANGTNPVTLALGRPFIL